METFAVIALCVIVVVALLIGGVVIWLYWQAEQGNNPFQ
jgi:predicted negative regulator of RcsB-dependent stress response